MNLVTPKAGAEHDLLLKNGQLDSGVHFKNISFSSQLTYGPNKIEHCSVPGWKGLPVSNALVYWTHP